MTTATLDALVERVADIRADLERVEAKLKDARKAADGPDGPGGAVMNELLFRTTDVRMMLRHLERVEEMLENRRVADDA